MKTAADDPTRELLQQQFDEINDALRRARASQELFSTVEVSNHHRPLRRARETGSAGVFCVTRWRAGKLSRQQIPQDRQDHDQQHGKDGAPPDASHSKTSYSNATPSGSFSSNHVSGLANTPAEAVFLWR
jgi:hypothetical protein